MTEENLVPPWAQELIQAIADTIEFKAQASLEGKLSGPEETAWDVDLVELWPALMEIQEAGPNDGEIVFGIVNSLDLLAAQKIFDEVQAVLFGFEDDGRSKITIEGKYKAREVVVLVYLEPEWDDDEDDAE